MSELEQIQRRLDELEAKNTELRNRVTELEEENSNLQERIDTLEEQPTIEGDDENLKSVTIGKIPLGRIITNKVSVYDLEEKIQHLKDDLDLGTQFKSKDTETCSSELTHIEQISRAAGDNISDITSSVDARRAVALWRNLPTWGRKTPKGYCLRSTDNPVSLLEADQDENLCWKQYYRACEALERLSEGSVTFFDSDRHGKMLVFHEQSEAFERVTRSLSTSSASASV